MKVSKKRSLCRECQSLLHQQPLIHLDVAGIADCMGWTWYLANDFQFSLLGITLLLISRRSKRAYNFLIGGTLFLSLFSILVLVLQSDLHVNRVQLSFNRKISAKSVIDPSDPLQTHTAVHILIHTHPHIPHAFEDNRLPAEHVQFKGGNMSDVLINDQRKPEHLSVTVLREQFSNNGP